MNTYHSGQRVRLTAAYTVSDVATDPTTVTLKLRDPAGTITTYTYGGGADVVKDSVGNYHADLTLSVEGIYRYRWAGTGAVVTAGEGEVRVLESVFA